MTNQTEQTQTLTEFLLARIDEDEERAEEQRLHDISRCHAVWHGRLGHLDREWADCECGYSARLLAECEAKRSITAEHVDGGSCMTTLGPVQHACACCRVPCPCPTLRALALPYADHPHYRQEWRP